MRALAASDNRGACVLAVVMFTFASLGNVNHDTMHDFDTKITRRHNILDSKSERPVWNLSGDPASPLMITCEHASNSVPSELQMLGLNDAQLQLHIAVDIGAAALARQLRDRLGARLMCAEYSRLVVDLNRYPDDESAVIEVSDGIEIPANTDLDSSKRAQRIQKYHSPYHQSLAAALDELQATNDLVFIVFLHSFTPQMDGSQRPWDIGLLFHDEGAVADVMRKFLEQDTQFQVGMNQPYSAFTPKSYSLFEHAVRRNLDYMTIEVRQDLLLGPTAITHMAEQIAPAIKSTIDRQNAIRRSVS